MKKQVNINVCMGTGGIAAGGKEVLDVFRKEFLRKGIAAIIEEGCCTSKVGCRGFCARDVLIDVVVDGKKATYECVTPDMVPRIVYEHVVGEDPVEEWLAKEDYFNFNKKQIKIVLSDCGEIDPEDLTVYIERGGYDAVDKVLKTLTPEETIKIIQKSGLRGRGGGGFPAGLKWELGRRTESDQKYIICNADEGDPGAFMDRSIIEGDPHAVIEGMIVVAAMDGRVYAFGEK